MNNFMIKGRILHFNSEPDLSAQQPYEYFDEGALVIKDGKVNFCGLVSEAEQLYPTIAVIDRSGQLIMPGFIDTHAHYPQTEIIGAYGEQLLSWLNTYTFPAEEKFSNQKHSEDTAEFFLNECLKNGTTTTAVFATVHPQSVEAFFEKSHALNMRNICGKVLMDRNAPENLLDENIDNARKQSVSLINKWHEKGRQHYAVTPRFTPSCSAEMMKLCKDLLTKFPRLYMQTHLAENLDECQWVNELEPIAIDYLDAYDRYGLVGPRSIFAHAIHLNKREYKRLAEAGAAIAHSPTSNLFLGSGLWNKNACQDAGIKVGIASDIGAGTSFSVFKTLNEAYKVQQLQEQTLSALQAFYLATLGGAKALYLDDKIGNFAIGHEADFIVIDTDATDLLKFRNKTCTTLEEELFVLMTLGDDRNIKETYVMGAKIFG